MTLLRNGAVGLLRICAANPRVSRLADYAHNRLVYERLKTAFIKNGEASRYESTLRRDLVRQFELIDENVPRATSRTDFLYIAETLLSLDCSGEVIECGCYAGASTCKLSLLAAITSRRLRVFDSFCGLPQTQEGNASDFHTRYPARSFAGIWKSGLYGCSRDQVTAALRRFGDSRVCSLYEGWFDRTLNSDNLDGEIALAFVDVDLPESVRTCVEAIWPRLSAGGAFFSHDVAFIKATLELLNPKMWSGKFGEFPPVLFGAGYGLGEYSPHLGFIIKSSDPGYIKSLTLQK